MISFIVPVYNSELYLEECISSILRQSYKDFELILVNDGSTDNSLSLCRSFSTDSRVKIVDKENGGVSSARNKGIEMSSGEYLMFVDSDDYLPQDSIDRLIPFMCDSDMAVGQFTYYYDGKTVLHNRTRLPFGVHLCTEISNNFIDDGTLSGFLIGSSCGILFRRDIIFDKNIRFNQEVRVNEDGLFNYCYVKNSRSVSIISASTYYVRKHDDSSTHTRSQTDDYNSIIKNYLYDIAEPKELESLNIQFRRRNVSIAMWNIVLFSKKYGIIKGTKYIREQITSDLTHSSYSTIDVSRLPYFKKVFLFMMKHNMAFCLFICSSIVIPLLSPYIKR